MGSPQAPRDPTPPSSHPPAPPRALHPQNNPFCSFPETLEMASAVRSPGSDLPLRWTPHHGGRRLRWGIWLDAQLGHLSA